MNSRNNGKLSDAYLLSQTGCFHQNMGKQERYDRIGIRTRTGNRCRQVMMEMVR